MDASLHTIGIDLGGTYLKGGILNAAGELVVRRVIDSEAAQGYGHVLERIRGFVSELTQAAGLTQVNISAIGLGVPGPVSFTTGIVHNAPNLVGWKQVPARDDLARLSGVRVEIENDANLAAFGEYTAGAAESVEDLVMLTLGTGVGAGIVIGGQIHRGAFGTAGEIGHLIVAPGGRPCPCGQRGCLERYASARAIADRTREALEAGANSQLGAQLAAGHEVTSLEVAEAAAAGDGLAAEMWSDACRYLAIACINLQHILNPRRIVLGGGLAGAGGQLLEAVRADLETMTWRMAEDRPEIVLASLDDNAGIIGAAALARVQVNRAAVVATHGGLPPA